MIFTPIGAVLTPTTTLSPDHQACVEQCLNAALEWLDGTMPWHVAANVGDIARKTLTGTMHRSTPYTRAVALRHTERSDPRWAALYALCGEINARLGYIETRQGTFTRAEMDDLAEHHRTAQRFTADRDPWEGAV